MNFSPDKQILFENGKKNVFKILEHLPYCLNKSILQPDMVYKYISDGIAYSVNPDQALLQKQCDLAYILQ